MPGSMHGEKFFLLCAKLAVGRPWLTLIVSLIVTAVAVFASTRMAVNTSNEGLFASDSYFVRNARAYEQGFPRAGASILAVVDAPTTDHAQAAARSLAERLRASALFHRVDAPGLDPFFTRAGLLFLSIDQLDQLRKQIEDADVALAVLSEQPDLRGISEFLKLITLGAQRGYAMPAPVTALVRGLAETARERAAGRATTLSWSPLFASGELQDRGKRQFVVAYAVADNSSMQGAAPAIATARQAAAAIIASDQGQHVSIRLAGEHILNQQELDAALVGATYASVLSFALVALTLVLGIRSLRLILILVGALIIGTVWTAGLAAVAVRELNLISFAFGVLFFGLGSISAHISGFATWRVANVAPRPRPR